MLSLKRSEILNFVSHWHSEIQNTRVSLRKLCILDFGVLD